MEVLMLTVFVSLIIAVCGVLFFAWNVHQRAHEHIDQLSLLPLDDDMRPTTLTSEKVHARARVTKANGTKGT